MLKKVFMRWKHSQILVRTEAILVRVADPKRVGGVDLLEPLRQFRIAFGEYAVRNI